MKDEIKEILDRLERIDHKEYSGSFEFADSSTFNEMARCFKERKKMADYITNLQKENKKLKDELDKEHYEYQEALEISYSNWCNERKRIKELEDRNEEHKEINGKLRVELEDLEKRINKAIKYIYELDINIVIKNTLKVILTHKGGD